MNKKKQSFIKLMTQHTHRIIAILFLFVSIVGTSSQLYAQALSVKATISKQALQMGERLTYKIMISGADLSTVPEPKLPDLSQRFSIQSTSESTSFSWVNGKVSSSKTIHYVLTPLKTGELIIGETALTFQGQTFKTNSLTVTVTPALGGNQQIPGMPAASSQGRPQRAPANQTQTQAQSQSQIQGQQRDLGTIFLASQTDKKEVYVGEQLIFDLLLYRRVQLWSNVSLQAPDFKGFWVEDLERRSDHYLQDVQGQRYYVFEIVKKALFPLTPGSYTINPGEVAFIINPFDGQQTLQGKPIQINVLPLPETDKPSDFSGLVGDFQLSAQYSKNQVDQNTPITLTLSVTGKGNLRSIQAIKFDDNPDFKIYKSKVTDEINNTDGISGKRLFEYIIIPKKAGTLQVPSFQLDFFSTIHKDYQTLSTNRFAIRSNPVKGSPSQDSLSQKALTRLKTDIHYIKSPVNLDRSHTHLFTHIGFLLAVLINGLLSLFLIWQWVSQNWFKKDRTSLASEKASATALKKLKTLLSKKMLSPKDLTKTQSILLTFLSHKTGKACLGISTTELKKILTQASLSEAKCKSIVTCLKNLDFALYSSSTLSDKDCRKACQNVQKLIQSLKSWRPIS